MIAVTAQQNFTKSGFSAQFLHSQTGGIFEYNAGCTTQHHPYLTIPECTRSPHWAGGAQNRQAIPAAA